MPWGSHDPQASTVSATAQASTFSTRTPLEHNNVSLVYTHSLVPVPHYKPKFTYRASDHPSISYVQSLTENFTPTGNYKLRKNSTKPVSYVPIDPNSDPSSFNYSLSSSLDSLDSGYYKQERITH